MLTPCPSPAAAVYLMDELAQLVGSHSDSINTAVDHIVRRLNNRSPAVKQKVGQARDAACSAAAQAALPLQPAQVAVNAAVRRAAQTPGIWM